MSTSRTLSSGRTARFHATVLSILSLWVILPKPCRADYTYGGTELSWEWLTDTSRAIVVGPVTSIGDDGFVLIVEQVLKRRGLAVVEGELLGGPSLGRTQLHDPAVLQRQIGWPALSDAATYPDDGAIHDCRWVPRFTRQETWTHGDRCLVFYGRDLQSPLQVINLEKPVTIEIDFLAVDFAGQPVIRPERLIQHIEERVAATQDDDGRPRVRSDGISYGVWSSPIDGDSYYRVLAPPEKVLASLWQPEILNRPAKLTTNSISYPAGEELGEPSMAPQSVWYWFFSGKSEEDFAADAQQERNAAVRELFRSERAERDIRRGIQHHGVTDYHRYQIYRRHRTNYRTYPLGWLCVRSYDQQYVAFVDGYTLQVYSVDAKSETVDRLVLVRRDAHRARTYVEFSRDSRFLAYTTAENAVSVVDLDEVKLPWTALPTTPAKGSASEYGSVTACLEFSGDQRYLAQQSQLQGPAPVEYPDTWGRNQGGQSVHVYDVLTGELIFTPYSTWQSRLRYVPFHPDNPSLIRLQRSGASAKPDEIWNFRTGELVRTLAEDAEWDEE